MHGWGGGGGEVDIELEIASCTCSFWQYSLDGHLEISNLNHHALHCHIMHLTANLWLVTSVTYKDGS